MKGFSLIELMVVLAIIALLTMIAMPNFTRYLAKAQRTEAYINLKSLFLAQKAYAADHQGKYAKNLTGKDSLQWNPGEVKYTYGFPSGGSASVIGTLQAPASALQGASVDGARFTMAAAGDIDGDGIPDVLTIDQDGKIIIVNDDLS